MSKKSGSNGNSWAGTRDEWQRRAGPHHVTLGSGMKVTFRVLGLSTLIRLDALPEDLNEAVVLHVANLDRGGLSAVIGEEMHKSISDPDAAARANKLTSDLGKLTIHLVAEALVEPKMTVEDLSDPGVVPEGDLEELMRLCTGRQKFDSAGVVIGVQSLEIAARFHHHHDIALDPELGVEGCAGCEALRDELSSIHLSKV